MHYERLTENTQLKKRLPEGEGVGGTSCGGGFSRFRLVMEGAERDLRRVEELTAFLVGNGADEYAVGRAGDEVADVFVSGKKGHGAAVSLSRVNGREDSVAVFVVSIAIVHIGFEGASPGIAATLERLGARGIGVEARGRRDYGQRDRNGFDQVEYCFG